MFACFCGVCSSQVACNQDPKTGYMWILKDNTTVPTTEETSCFYTDPGFLFSIEKVTQNPLGWFRIPPPFSSPIVFLSQDVHIQTQADHSCWIGMYSWSIHVREYSSTTSLAGLLSMDLTQCRSLLEELSGATSPSLKKPARAFWEAVVFSGQPLQRLSYPQILVSMEGLGTDCLQISSAHCMQRAWVSALVIWFFLPPHHPSL